MTVLNQYKKRKVVFFEIATLLVYLFLCVFAFFAGGAVTINSSTKEIIIEVVSFFVCVVTIVLFAFVVIRILSGLMQYNRDVTIANLFETIEQSTDNELAALPVGILWQLTYPANPQATAAELGEWCDAQRIREATEGYKTVRDKVRRFSEKSFFSFYHYNPKEV